MAEIAWRESFESMVVSLFEKNDVEMCGVVQLVNRITTGQVIRIDKEFMDCNNTFRRK